MFTMKFTMFGLNFGLKLGQKLKQNYNKCDPKADNSIIPVRGSYQQLFKSQ